MNNARKLSDLKSGEQAVVIALDGCGAECQCRLVSIGIRPGCQVEIISRTPGGQVMVNSSNGRIALGCGMAQKVIVEQKEL
jgi:Fe2+ transport system protein FeoA